MKERENKNRMSVFSLDGTDFSIAKEMPDWALITGDFAMILEVSRIREKFIEAGQLYNFVEGRILLITDGHADVEINLEECRLEKGDVMLIVPEVIVEFKQASDDFNFTGIMFREDVSLPRMVHLRPSEGDRRLVERMMRLLWDVAHYEPFRSATVKQLLTTIVSGILEMEAESKATRPSDRESRQKQLFRRFKKLVSRHCASERTVAFYAGELCISPHYLSGVVSAVSGHTVMYWINRAVILQAKVMLKTGDMMIYEIADRLNFPNQSFFGRFFKRETGMTPGEFQKGNGREAGH